MARAWPIVLLLLVGVGLAFAPTSWVAAGEEPPAPPAPPAAPGAEKKDAEEAPKLRLPEPADIPLAEAEDVEEALAVFQDAFKAKGLKGDDRLSQRDWAMSHLIAVQHPEVVKTLAKLTKHSDSTIRILAVIYLGELRAMPALAGDAILAAMARNKKNDVLLMSGLQALGRLQYIGGGETITTLIKHRNFAIKKTAILAVGDTRDMRLLSEVLTIAGISDYKHNNNQKEVVSEGYSYEGVDVTYDTGTAGDHDQQMAEKIGKEQLAKNKAAATGGGGSAFGGGASGMGTGGGGGGSGRSKQELLQAALKSLFRLTGEKFTKSSEVRKWLRLNHKLIGDTLEALEKIEKDQKTQAKEQKKG